jgi:hypothetical protein
MPFDHFVDHGRDTIHRVDTDLAKRIIAENDGLPVDTATYCRRNNVRIDAYTPHGIVAKAMTDYSDIDHFVDSYGNMGNLWEMYGGADAWETGHASVCDNSRDAGCRVVKQCAGRIAVDIAMRQLTDAGIATVVRGDAGKATADNTFVRIAPSKK